MKAICPALSVAMIPSPMLWRIVLAQTPLVFPVQLGFVEGHLDRGLELALLERLEEIAEQAQVRFARSMASRSCWSAVELSRSRNESQIVRLGSAVDPALEDDIHQDEVGPVLARPADGLGGRRDQAQGVVAEALEHVLDVPADQALVLDDKDAVHRAGLSDPALILELPEDDLGPRALFPFQEEASFDLVRQHGHDLEPEGPGRPGSTRTGQPMRVVGDDDELPGRERPERDEERAPPRAGEGVLEARVGHQLVGDQAAGTAVRISRGERRRSRRIRTPD